MAICTQNHVFIVTYGRSGSTVLQRILQSIDGYFIRGENNNTLFPLFLAYRRAFEARHGHGNSDHHASDPWYGANNIDPETFAQNLVELFVRDIVQPPTSARVVGFKEIRFHEAGEDLFEPYLDFIAANFPASKFIFNMRRWQDVAKSSWWATMDPSRVRAIIEDADKMYTNYAAKHPETSLVMQYESFVGNPDAFAPLFAFLGEPYKPDDVAELLGDRLLHARNVGQEKDG